MNTKITKTDSWQMFNTISPKYDFLNHFLSFGLDIHWRNQLIKYLPGRSSMNIADIATGTADVLISLAQKHENVQGGTGFDMAQKMLDIGHCKIEKLGLQSRLKLHHANAKSIPAEDGTFDATTIAFGIRNIDEPVVALKEMNRILKSGGRSLVLEFSFPKNAILKWGHLFYLRYVVPIIGFIFSGNYSAYKYLNETIESFPYGDVFCKLMDEAGFKNIKSYPLLFGVATIYSGDK